MTYKKLPLVKYTVVRSRNNGEYWVEIYTEIYDEAEAVDLMERYHEKHPSDWLKVVKEEYTNVRTILGNKKKNIRNNEFEKFIHDAIRLGVTQPILEEQMPTFEPVSMPCDWNGNLVR